jgi:hypothetical protein
VVLRQFVPVACPATKTRGQMEGISGSRAVHR